MLRLLVMATCLAAIPNIAEARHVRPQIFRLLRDQGFSRPLSPTASIRFLGTVTSANVRYNVHYYSYVNPESRHGRQSLIFIRNGARYIGAYEANMARCHVQRNTVYCRDGTDVELVRLVNGRPPRQVLIGGEISTFYK